MRKHDIFDGPNRIDIAATRPEPTPKAWEHAIATAEVQVLPLVDGPKAGPPGWCTSDAHLDDSPEIEVMCGGINTKTPGYAALWRQGNLLHFGFEETPLEFNATGRALLENAVAYIARFEEDRPIVFTASTFVDRNVPRTRNALRSALESPDVDGGSLAVHFGEGLRETVRKMGADEAGAWARENMGFLVSDGKGLLTIDPDAKALGVAIDRPGFLAKALELARVRETAEAALALLARRAPEGPGTSGSTEDWERYLEVNKDYLFFSETAGYVWRLDPLAKKRRIPSAELRGSLRATPGQRGAGR